MAIMNSVFGLSLDPNPTVTGYVIWKDELVLDWGVVKSLETDLPPWLQMSLYLWDFIETVHTGTPLSWIAVEGVFSGPNPKVFGELSRIVGIIDAVAVRMDIPCFELATVEIDQLTGVQHFGRKAGNMALAKLMLRQDKIPQDIADALAVGIAGFGKYNHFLARENARQVDRINRREGLVPWRDKPSDGLILAQQPSDDVVRPEKGKV